MIDDGTKLYRASVLKEKDYFSYLHYFVYDIDDFLKTFICNGATKSDVHRWYWGWVVIEHSHEMEWFARHQIGAMHNDIRQDGKYHSLALVRHWCDWHEVIFFYAENDEYRQELLTAIADWVQVETSKIRPDAQFTVSDINFNINPMFDCRI